jgi:hypothetical protein
LASTQAERSLPLTNNTPAASRKTQFDAHHGISKLTQLHKKVGPAGVLNRPSLCGAIVAALTENFGLAG